MNGILNINNVHGYLDKETGTAYLNAEDVARGLGFTTVAKSGNEVVRWARVNRLGGKHEKQAHDHSTEAAQHGKAGRVGSISF